MPKNFRQIPEEVRERLQTFALEDVIVACAKRLRQADILRYSHLGLRFEEGRLVVPLPFVPDVSAGRYSKFNTKGKDVPAATFRRSKLPETLRRKFVSFSDVADDAISYIKARYARPSTDVERMNVLKTRFPGSA